MTQTLDCIIVGFNKPDLQTNMSNLEKMKHVSGAYRQMRKDLIRFHNKWITGMDFLNNILYEATRKKYDLHLTEVPNLALCYLKSFLARRNFNVEVVNLFNKDKKKLADLLGAGPQAVAITTSLYMEDSPIREIVQFIREHNTETSIIAGGPRIFNICNTLDVIMQDYLLEKIGADIYISDSQGEETLASVLCELRKGKKRCLGDIPNLVFHKNSQAAALSGHSVFERTPRRIEANSMDKNIIDWNFFPKTFYTPTVYMRTARGCAFSCAFCTFPFFAGPLTQTSIERVEQEMKQLHRVGVKNIIFIDDTFNVPLSRFKKLLKMMIANGFGFRWNSFFRCANADDETFDLMKESGCFTVRLGIESGDQQILDNMNKHVTIDKYRRSIHQLHQRGIITDVSFIVGFPGETKETIQNTINFIEETQPTYYHLSLYFHSLHAPIHGQAAKHGLRGTAYSWQHNTMNWREALDMAAMMYNAIRGSISPADITSLALIYLAGKGVSLMHTREFVRLLDTLLSKSADRTINSAEGIYQNILYLGREIAHDLESENKQTDS